MAKPKLIIHETNCHGCGNIYYDGTFDTYTYDDGEWGDIRRAVEKLIDIGFINRYDVEIFEDNEDIYKLVEKGLNVE